jgi:hypothetical protein
VLGHILGDFFRNSSGHPDNGVGDSIDYTRPAVAVSKSKIEAYLDLKKMKNLFFSNDTMTMLIKF